MTLESLYQELEELRRWPENWNSYNAVPVDHAAIDHARIVLTCFYRAARDDWFAPSITADAAEGDVVFEWWYGPRKVTMYISPFSTEYVQVWGNDPKCKIDDGDIC